MLLGQLRNARLRGELVGLTAPANEAEHSTIPISKQKQKGEKMMSRLTIGPALFVHPDSMKSPNKRRDRNTSRENGTRSKRMANVHMPEKSTNSSLPQFDLPQFDSSKQPKFGDSPRTPPNSSASSSPLLDPFAARPERTPMSPTVM